MHTFTGKWITTSELAALPVYDVYQRDIYHRKANNPVQPNPYAYVNNRHVLFRRKFTLASVAPTRIFITADDYYKLYINGRFVGQGPAPCHQIRYYYNEMDITPYLVAGENTIAVHTYYQGLINRVWCSGNNRHGLLFDVVADGKTVVVSDESMLQHLHSGFSVCGEVGYSTQFMERYDANAPEVGFEQPGFDDSKWQNAVVNPKDDYTLCAQPSRQLVFEEVKPAKLMRTRTGYLVDFGAIYVGYLAFAARGPKYSDITLKFGQELNADGSVREQLRCNCLYVEHFVLSGKLDTLNEFDYKSFRYVELILPMGAAIDESSVRFIVRHYPFELKATCKYDDAEHLTVWKFCVDSMRYGAQETIMDCMDREKGYYLGDGCYTVLTHCLLTQDFTLLEKFFDDFLDTSFFDRGLLADGCCSFMQRIAEYPLMMIETVLPYLAMTGNTRFIAERYDKFKDVLEYYRESYAEADGLLNNIDRWCVVEWPANYRDGYEIEPEGKMHVVKNNVINAFYIGAVKALNRMAKMVGREPYMDVAALEAAFVKAFYLPEKHLFRDNVASEHVSMPGNVFAAFHGLAPEAAFHAEFLKMVRAKCMKDILLFQTFPLLAYLKCRGEDELVKELLVDKEAWLKTIEEGGTRTVEGWRKDGKWNTSLFHLTMTQGACFLTDWPIKEAYCF